MNKALLIGHLGKDPEIRRTQAGAKVANFSLATSRRWTDKASGDRKEVTEWHRVVVFNEQLADVVEKYLKKGAKVYVEGEICTRKYEKDGDTRYITEIILGAWRAQIIMLDRKEGGVPHAEGEADYGSASPTTTREDLDDEIPF